MFKEVEDKFEANIAILVVESFGYGHILEKLYYKVDRTEDISNCIADMTDKIFVPYDADICVRRVRFGRILGRE